MEYYEHVCPNCGTAFYGPSKSAGKCHMCKKTTVFTGYTKDEYNALTQEEQIKIKADIRNGKIRNSENNNVASDKTLWLWIQNTLVNIFIFIGIIASVVCGIILMCDEEIWLGLLVCIVGSAGTLLTVSLVKVFLGVAKDIRYIRKKLESDN